MTFWPLNRMQGTAPLILGWFNFLAADTVNHCTKWFLTTSRYIAIVVNSVRFALLVEELPLGHVTPLLLQMISVVPPDWSFMFLGSNISLSHVNASMAIRLHQESGKWKLREVPSNTSYGPGAQINHMFTDLSFYQKYLDSAEWLLVFQTDSILCAPSEISLDEWLEYD